MPYEDTFNKFHRLISKGDVIAVLEFIASGVDVDIRNLFGWTPLMLAAGEGHTAIVSLLLSAGANVKAVNNFRRIGTGLCGFAWRLPDHPGFD